MGGCTDFSYYDVTIKAAVEFGVGTFKAYKAVFFTMIDPMTRSTSPNYPKNKIRKKLWKFVVITPKPRRTPFNLINFYDEKFKLVIWRI